MPDAQRARGLACKIKKHMTELTFGQIISLATREAATVCKLLINTC
jgi:hypothetical protein